MLGQTSGVSYSQQNKDKSKYKRTFGNELVSSSKEILHLTKEYATYVIFYLQLTWFIYSTFSEFNNCLVLIAFRLTIHNRCSKYSPPESLHEWTRLIVDCSTLSKVLGRLRMVLQASEMPWWRLSSLSVGDEYTRSFSLPTKQAYKGLRLARSGAAPRQQFADIYWYELCSLVWCGKLAPVVGPNILDIPWVIVFANTVLN